MPSSPSRYPSGLWGVSVVSLGFVQRQVWRLRRAAPHALHPNAPGQQRSCLPPAGGGEEVLPRQLLMTKPGTSGEEREERKEREEREESQEREERTETEKQQKVRGAFSRGINMMNSLLFSLFLWKCTDWLTDFEIWRITRQKTRLILESLW